MFAPEPLEFTAWQGFKCKVLCEPAQLWDWELLECRGRLSAAVPAASAPQVCAVGL